MNNIQDPAGPVQLHVHPACSDGTYSPTQPIDLHVHSTCSDGTYSPTQLVDYAVQKGLAAFALTDHDSVDGLEEAIQYAARLRTQQISGKSCMTDSKELTGNVHGVTETEGLTGKSPDVIAPVIPEVIPGIELSTEYQGRDIHIVGLYIDYHSQLFLKKLQEFVDSRVKRNQKMCALLRQSGIHITYDELLASYPDSVITRAHYAAYLLEKGYVKSRQEAFDRYVGDHAPCYIPREKITPAQAVHLILDAHGAPVLAHPIQYNMSRVQLEALVQELKEEGLMGIEAVYSTYTAADERRIRTLAAKYGLFISGGSDFHGANKPGLDLGTGYGKLYVPLELLQNIRKALE